MSASEELPLTYVDASGLVKLAIVGSKRRIFSGSSPGIE
jgi:hypothetical protein